MSEERLDRIERILEGALSDIVASFDYAKERSDQQQSQINVNQVHIGALAESQRSLTENQRSIMETQRSLMEAQRSMMDAIERLTAIQAETSEKLASIGAAVEHLDAICDYLLKKDNP